MTGKIPPISVSALYFDYQILNNNFRENELKINFFLNVIATSLIINSEIVERRKCLDNRVRIHYP